jgi:hypothetical protein
MTPWKGVLLSLPVVAVALGALAVGLVELGRYWSLGLISLAFLAVPLVLAVVYIQWYRGLPYEPPGARARGTSASFLGAGAEESFEDPVEEADRFDQLSKTGSPPEEPAIVEDDSAADSPPVR